MKNGWHTDDYGTRRHYVGDRRHRDDGPAVIWPDGYEQWYRDDRLHRDDGPAVTTPRPDLT